jgi:hypothetical protein
MSADHDPAGDTTAPAPASGSPRPRLALVVWVALLAGALALAGLFHSRWRAGEVNAWGWDESMHAALPAGEIVLALQAGDVAGAQVVLHSCERYPPVTALVLAGPMACFGVSELVARSTLLSAWLALGVLGLALLARELARARAGHGGEARARSAVAALLAGSFALLSPLANRYAPTLFIEPLFAALLVLTLLAHLRARRRAAERGAAPGAAVLTGLVLTAAIFTKWNYGALLAGGLAVDFAVELVLALRHGRARLVLERAAWTLLPPAVALLWWFVLPLPLGGDVAARHRIEALDYLTSNQEMPPVPAWMRSLSWYRGVAPHPALLLALVLGALRTLPLLSSSAVRTLWVVGLVVGVPCSIHPFFLDRFLLAPAVMLFALAGLGWADVLTSGRVTRVVAGALGAAALAAWALVPTFRLAPHLGFPVNADPRVADYQRDYVEEALGPVAPPASNGLPRSAHEDLLARIAAALGPRERIGWVGQSQEVSPASLHFGLLARGGAPERFRADAAGPMDLQPVPGLPDPGFDVAEVLAWASGFDALVLCTPVDLKARPARAWIAERWHAPILAAGWSATTLGSVEIPKPPGPPALVEVRLARRP